MLRFASLISRSGIVVAAVLAFFGAQITAAVAQQAEQQQVGRTNHQAGEPKASGKRTQPGSASASPGNPRAGNPETVASDASASTPGSSLAEGPQSSSGMRLMRYGRQSRVYGLH